MMAPRKPEKFAEMRAKSRELILSKAIEIFAVHGYYKASVAMIAEAAGISKGLIYNYFKSKDELLEYVFMEGFSYFDEIVKLDHAEISAYNKLEKILTNFTQTLQGNLSFWKLYQNVISQPEISHKLTKFKEFYESVFGPLLMGIFFEFYGDTMTEEEIVIEVMIFAAFLDGIAFDFTVMGEAYPLDAITQRLLEKYHR